MRYSPGCQSEWATVTDTNRPDGAIFWIYDRGTHALEVATTERATFTRQWQTTKMVGVAKTKAQACIEVRNPHGISAPLCTPFIPTRAGTTVRSGESKGPSPARRESGSSKLTGVA